MGELVKLGPFDESDLAAGPLVIYTPADGAVVTDVDLADITLDRPTSITFAITSPSWPQVITQVDRTKALPTQLYPAAITDAVELGVTAGGDIARAWAAGEDVDGLTNVFGAGHVWILNGSDGTTGGVEPDWAANIGGTVVDGSVEWLDVGPLPTGQLTVYLDVGAPLGAGASDAYAPVSELARILKIRTPTADQTIAMQRVLDAARTEIDNELGRTTAFDPPYPPLVVQVNLDRAEELWQQSEATLGFVGLGGEAGPARVAVDTWLKHAVKLAPLKATWGIG